MGRKFLKVGHIYEDMSGNLWKIVDDDGPGAYRRFFGRCLFTAADHAAPKRRVERYFRPTGVENEWLGKQYGIVKEVQTVVEELV